MEKAIIIILLTVFTFSCKSQEKIDVDEVWTKFQNTVADKETISEIKTSYKVTKTKMKQGMFTMKTYIKYPDKVYSISEYGDELILTYILNGENGIVIGEGKQREMNNSELIMYKDYALIFPETRYSSKSGEISYIGEVKDNDESYYKIRINKLPNDNEKAYYLIDKKTFEFHKMLIDETGVFEMLENQIISGVNTIKKTRLIRGRDTIISNVIENKFNIEIDDNLFNID